MMASASNPTRPCLRPQLSRHDRIARIVQRVVQRCACELTGGAPLRPAPAMARVTNRV
jgi:hypothetical protein